ncbi:MAG: hypothetical protein GWN00_19520 [Aliifodinibius sp.]|nr:hypothetical protein [Fodinibius sp.]NIY26914.1 hypothetical protein [Fodinibius sp.]
MKKVSMNKVEKGDWKLSYSSRSKLNDMKENKGILAALSKYVDMMKDLISATNAISNKIEAIPPPVVNVEVPPIKVDIPVDKTKKRFQLKVVRDEEGFIKSIDIKQV